MWCVEEVLEEGGDDIVGGCGEWAGPFLPRWVIVFCGEVVEDVRGQKVRDVVDDALAEETKLGLRVGNGGGHRGDV